MAEMHTQQYGGLQGCGCGQSTSKISKIHRDVRIEDRRGRNLRYRAREREREVAIRAPVVSLAPPLIAGFILFLFSKRFNSQSALTRERDNRGL